MTRIAVVVPSCRPERLKSFMAAWSRLFQQHDCTVLVVRDDTPACELHLHDPDGGVSAIVGDAASVLGDDVDLVPRQSPACRCIGFAYLAKWKHDIVVTLDDDLVPKRDTIWDHVAALSMRVPTSWMSSTSWGSPYMRGFPYAIRHESPVWVSHGVWENVPDLDAPTQLLLGDTPPVEFYRGPVPKGAYFPVCGMNLAFRWEAMRFMYWSPAKRLRGAERFDDIWMGIRLTRSLSAVNAALVTGFASCVHTRASDTFRNLEQEARGIGINEHLWNNCHWSMGDDVSTFFRDEERMARRWAARFDA